MRIGILTYQRAENYGALLQAYATKSFLKGLGHDAELIDYWPEYHSDYFKVFSWKRFRRSSIKTKVLILIRLILIGHSLYRRKKKLQVFMRERLELPEHPVYHDMNCTTEKYDIAVYGSDQIWRKQNMDGVGFDPWYFGSDNVQARKKIVYAGSMGKVETDAEDDLYVKTQMQHFHNIAVREKDLQDYLHRQGVSSTLVIDPVFLLTKEQWHRLAVAPQSDSPYILFYNLLNTSESTAFANELSVKTGLPIREITKKTILKKKGNRFIVSASVEEFLGLIEHAAYVVSNSFHGVAFSIIFEKQFFAVGMGEKSNRVVSLLEDAGIRDYYLEVTPKQIPASEIDFEMVKSRLQEKIRMSKSYLTSIYEN